MLSAYRSPRFERHHVTHVDEAHLKALLGPDRILKNKRKETGPGGLLGMAGKVWNTIKRTWIQSRLNQYMFKNRKTLEGEVKQVIGALGLEL